MSELSNNDLCKTLLEAIQTSAKETKEEVVKQIEKENQKIIDTLNDQIQKINNLEVRYNKLDERQLQHERRIRRNNIIIFGAGIDSEINLLTRIITLFKELLNLTISETDIDNFYLLKNKNEPHRIPIKVEFVSCWKKDLIIKNAFKLKGTSVVITQDLCWEDREDRRYLLTVQKELKTQNKVSKILNGNRLFVDGATFTIPELKLSRHQHSTTKESTQVPLETVSKEADLDIITESRQGNKILNLKDNEKRKREQLAAEVTEDIKKPKVFTRATSASTNRNK